MTEPTFHCPRCGEETERLFEGYCEPCCEQGQRELDQHNAEVDRWSRLSMAERHHEIVESLRRG